VELKMNKSKIADKVKRYIIFLFGLFISSLGVSVITKANLGTSPISSIPYVLSLKFSPTLGEFTVIFSVILVLLQILILRKNFKAEDLIQLPVSVLFGYFIDFTMIILKRMNPDLYILKVLGLAMGCIILAFGIYLEVIADVVMLPGEAFVRSIVRTWNANFGNTKVIFDASMCVTAGLLSFIFFSGLCGVREGTVFSALAVGFVVKLFSKILNRFPEMLFRG